MYKPFTWLLQQNYSYVENLYIFYLGGKVFLYNAMYLVGIGLFWGNVLGLGFLFVQKYFKIISLNPQTYYVTEAPVDLDFGNIALLNIGTFILCLAMLLIPSYVISKISPVKAIRFE